MEESRFDGHWILGQPQSGKTTYLEQLAIKDMGEGHGVFYIDPHGSDNLLEQIPEHRHDDVIIFDIADIEHPIALNPIKTPDPHAADLLTDALVGIWGYGDMATPQLDQTVYNSLTAMQYMHGGSVLGMYLLFTNPHYRYIATQYIGNDVVKDFWIDFQKAQKREQTDLIKSTINKIQKFIADPRIQNIFARPTSAFSFKEIFEQKKILIARLPLSNFTEQKVATIGSLLIADFLLNVHHNTEDFAVHIDDAFYFQTPVFKSLLALAGRNRVAVAFVTSFLNQLKPDLLNTFIGNIGRKTAFRLGYKDGLYLTKDFHVSPGARQLYDLGWLEYYDTLTRKAAAIPQLADIESTDTPHCLRQLSRLKYASQRTQVEANIARFLKKYPKADPAKHKR